MSLPPEIVAIAPQSREFGHYIVQLYAIHRHNLAVVFVSAGQAGLGEPVEEFRNSLSRFGCSMMFVIDREPSWLNNPQAAEMLAYASAVTGFFKNVAVLGESMGGSCALQFAETCPHAQRILAIAPQYSVGLPFIAFDARFAYIGRKFPHQAFWSFAPPAALPRAQILFGDRDHLDAVHAGLFVLEGFSVHFVREAAHLLAQRLKQENRLLPVLAALLDFDEPFDAARLAAALGPLKADRAIDPAFSFAAQRQRQMAAQLAGRAAQGYLPAPADEVEIGAGCPASQSSLSPWSVGASLAEDAANALRDGEGPYAFHTGSDAVPWWRVDLMRRRAVTELRIYNRIDNAECARRGVDFVIECADDGEDWRVLLRKDDGAMFGGTDGRPFIWRPAAPVATRHLRIRLLAGTCMHYKRIEIFGPPAP